MGHGMGAIIGYEVAKVLYERYNVEPFAFVPLGSNPPHINQAGFNFRKIEKS